MSNSEITKEEQKIQKDILKFKIFYPLSEFLSGIQKQFFGIYLQFFYTNIYMFSVTFTATMTLTSNLVSWIVTPTFSAFVDRFKFKKAKYWPWLIFGTLIVYGIQMTITLLPYATGKTTTLAGFVFALVLCQVVLGPMGSAPIMGAFPKMGKTPADRQFLAMGQKVGRDGGKTLFGYIVPVLLAAFTASTGSEMGGYAMTGIVAAVITIAGFWMLALFALKGSYVEKEAMEETERAKAAKIPLSQIVKTLTSNRPLLGIFAHFLLHKSYYFLYTSYAMYQFTYVFNNPAGMSIFFTVFNLTAVIGVMFGGVYTKIFKDSKRAHAACFISHMVFLLIIALFYSKMSMITFVAVFGCSSFFMGMLENWILPGFAAAADYGAWVSGTRMDAFLMSIYSLSVMGSLFVTTLVGSTILNSVNYTEFVASGAAATPEIIRGISMTYTWAPLVLSCLSLCCLLFIYNLNDKRISAIQADIKEGKTKATSSIDWNSLK
ncbi:MAG: MFS transporter [Eubacteriales bacterium]|nr:MFS transporter [Eubacteriales bacterium]